MAPLGLPMGKALASMVFVVVTVWFVFSGDKLKRSKGLAGFIFIVIYFVLAFIYLSTVFDMIGEIFNLE